MKSLKSASAFSTVEVLTVVAILIILVTLVLGLGKRLRDQAAEKLTESGIDVIVTALQQYYDFYNAFPFEAENTFDPADDFDQVVLESLLSTEPDLGAGTISGVTVYDEYASSEGLFYFLEKFVESRRIIGTMNELLTSNRDADGNLREFVYGGETLVLVRFIDAWGNSLRYTYMAGDNFPLIESAGPDGNYQTLGDNINSR